MDGTLWLKWIAKSVEAIGIAQDAGKQVVLSTGRSLQVIPYGDDLHGIRYIFSCKWCIDLWFGGQMRFSQANLPALAGSG